jgi:hypothetical protein
MATELLITNLWNDRTIEAKVSPSGGGVKADVTVGPQSFVEVSTALVNGPFPWSVFLVGGGNSSVTKLPAIVCYGIVPNNLTSVLYPP